MFATPVAKPKTKSAESQRATVVPHGPSQSAVEQAHVLQRSIGNQAMLRHLARRASANETGTQEDEADAAREAAPGVAWDFSKIPVFAPGESNQSRMRSVLTAPQFPGRIKAKLAIGRVDDPLKHEANRVADQVMRMPAPEVSVAAAPPQVSHKCDTCEEEEKLQQKPARPQATAGEAPAIVHEVLRSPGEPLDAATRDFFEPRFGHDFSHVRVHADEHASTSAKAVGALAYTVGSDIVFGVGDWSPLSDGGRRLLADELTHVIQQGESQPSTSVQREIGRQGFGRTIASDYHYGCHLATAHCNPRRRERLRGSPAGSLFG
ncbi:MAG: hypothetical protein CR217_14080 [Beijerinckiaceae bacterium]|nr:MAG: hypothetical protein CR217_14080 [Beijerinckiaceae bacterium]